MKRADAVLNKAKPEDIDLLVLPELAFTGELDLDRVLRLLDRLRFGSTDLRCCKECPLMRYRMQLFIDTTH